MSKIAEKLGMKKRVNYFETPYTFRNAMKEGSNDVKISMAVMGFANIKNKQIVKGLIFLAIEIAYLYFMIANGFHCLAMLPSLGTRAPEKVWNEAKGIYEYTAGDNSILILLYGVVTLAITLLFVIAWRATVCRHQSPAFRAGLHNAGINALRTALLDGR